MRVRIATRGSPLARWQAEHVAGLLRTVDVSVETELVLVETTADRLSDAPIWTMGGKGVFVKEVEAAVLDGNADVAVHSAKDLTSGTPDGLVLTAVPERGDPRDALVGLALDDLPVGGLVATGSARRRAQLANLRPDLTFTGLRGNIHRRLERVGEVDAVMVAVAALDRLGLDDRIADRLPVWQLVPQVAQGALAVQSRAGSSDEPLRRLVQAIEHRPSRRAVDAERAYLAELGGDCNLPAGAHATVDADGAITLDALLASLDGHYVLRHRATGDDPETVGREAARHLLDAGGASVLLAG